jgi:hypothetical protein
MHAKLAMSNTISYPLFPMQGRAPDGYSVILSYIGGAQDSGISRMDKTDIIKQVHERAGTRMGLRDAITTHGSVVCMYVSTCAGTFGSEAHSSPTFRTGPHIARAEGLGQGHPAIQQVLPLLLLMPIT